MADFVTYKVGKKLKEKGYSHDYNGFGYLPIYSDECTIKLISYIGSYEQEYFGENIPCPTISEVLKWLREEKTISVEPCATPYNCWYYMIKCKGEIKVTYMDNKYRTYEAASIAGIEYVLDKLI
jgi:hypothetical protein